MRQFISDKEPDNKGLLSISGKDYRYLRQVLRLHEGDMLSVRTPSGSLMDMTVCTIIEDKKIIKLQICSSLNNDDNITRGVKAEEIDNAFTSTDYYLFQYIAKPSKMELIIRQAVECGVKYIIPITGEFSQKSSIQAITSSKSDRIERIIREARQQSGSPVDTCVLPPMTSLEAQAYWSKETSDIRDNSIGVVLWERDEDTMTIRNILSGKKQIKKVAVAVGCEGGISQDEITTLKEGGFVPIHFAINILRCETAALYGIASVQSAVLEG